MVRPFQIKNKHITLTSFNSPVVIHWKDDDHDYCELSKCTCSYFLLSI